MSQTDVVTGEAPKRYAMALLDLAPNATALKSLEKDLKAVKKMFASSEDLRRLASSPVFATEDKVSALLAVAKKAKIGKLATQFIGLVASNRRAEELPAMITAFESELRSIWNSMWIQTCSAVSSCGLGLNFMIALSRHSLRILISR